MELSPSVVGALVLVAIVVGLLAIGLAIAALQGQRKVRQTYARFAMGRDDDVLTLIADHVDVVEALRGDVADLRDYADALRVLIAQGLSRAATVRYDAYDDMGGRMSFSTALLDERGDGVIVTSINGRVETRTYAKTVTGAQSAHNLSAEEETAIRRALSGEGRTPSPRPRSSDRRAATVRPLDEGAVEEAAVGENAVGENAVGEDATSQSAAPTYELGHLDPLDPLDDIDGLDHLDEPESDDVDDLLTAAQVHARPYDDPRDDEDEAEGADRSRRPARSGARPGA